MFAFRTTPFILLLNFLTADLSAQWSNNPAINNVVANNPRNEALPFAITDGAGGSIIFFSNYGASLAIFAQRISKEGLIEWTTTATPVTLSDTTSSQSGYFAIPDEKGGAFIAWSDNKNNPSATEIYMQHIDAAGTNLWGANGLRATNTLNTYNQQPVLCPDGAGGLIISWTLNDNISLKQVMAQRYNAAGQPQWTSAGINICTARSYRRFSNIVSDGSNGAIIFFRDTRNDPSWSDYNYYKRNEPVNEDIYAQRIDGSGSLLWTADGVPVCTAVNNQYTVGTQCAISDGNGGAIVAFQDTRYDASETIRDELFVQKINGDGTAAWQADGTSVTSLVGFMNFGAIVSDNSGGAVIAFEDETDTYGRVYCQKISSTGAASWTADGLAFSPGEQYCVSPEVGSDGAGNFIFTYGIGESNSITKAQKINATGIKQWPDEGTIICSVLSSRRDTKVITSDTGSVILVWAEARNSFYRDIFSSKLLSGGALAGTALPVYTTISNGNWDDPATWAGGVVPPVNSIVVVINEILVNIDVTCYSLYVRPPGNVKVNPGIKITITH